MSTPTSNRLGYIKEGADRIASVLPAPQQRSRTGPSVTENVMTQYYLVGENLSSKNLGLYLVFYASCTHPGISRQLLANRLTGSPEPGSGRRLSGPL